MLGDAAMVLGTLVGGEGTTTIGCLGGAQIDRFGNVNSTRIEPRPFLVGSGGGQRRREHRDRKCCRRNIDTPAHPRRTARTSRHPAVLFAPLITDLGLFEKLGDLASSELVFDRSAGR